MLIKPCGRWSHFTALVIGALLKRMQTLRSASGDKNESKGQQQPWCSHFCLQRFLS